MQDGQQPQTQQPVTFSPTPQTDGAPDTLSPAPTFQPAAMPQEANTAAFSAPAPEVQPTGNAIPQPPQPAITYAPPAVPAPPVPQPWAAAQSSTPTVGLTPQQPSAKASPLALLHKLPVKIGIAIVAVAAIAAVAAIVILHRPVTHADVLTALQAAEHLDKDMSDASLDYNDMSVGADSSTTTIAANVDTINSKLDDAQKQMGMLKGSPVLRDSNVNKKFQALQAKFNPYVTYIRQNTADNKVLMPIVSDFETKMRALSQSNPSTASEVAAYLQNLKSIIDSTSQRLDGVTVQSDVNKQGVAAIKAYLQSLSGIVTQTQSDMAAGKDVFTLEDDLLKSYSADTTYSKALEDVNQQELTNQQRLDTQSELSDFLSALTSLSITVKN